MTYGQYQLKFRIGNTEVRSQIFSLAAYRNPDDTQPQLRDETWFM
jgi:hypothetical protein